MKAQIKILTGARAGLVHVFSKPYLEVGRHPTCDLEFDPAGDLDVSTRHAALRKQGEHWYIRDLGSRNGTLVNGHPVQGDVKLDDTDQIRFGATGPAVEFRLVADSTPDVVQAPTQAAAAQTPAGTTQPEQGEQPRRTVGSSTTQRILIEVAQQTRKLRITTGVLFGVLIVVAGGFFYQSFRQQQTRERDVAVMQRRIDSILRASDVTVQALRGELAGLANALRSSRAEVRGLQSDLELAQAAGNAEQIALLRERLDAASAALRNQQAAAQVDYAGIIERSHRAVAIIWVDFGNRDIVTGTAFAVDSSGIMLTNKHVVAGESGNRTPRRIAIQFAESDQVFQARLLGIARDADVAAVRVILRGTVPVLKLGSVGRARPGDPVAVIGFPMGVELPMMQRGERTVPKTTFIAGTISKVLPELVQIDGYGAQGASGSPILDRSGSVVAILYGGQPGSRGRIVYSVPVSYASSLLQSVN